MPGGERPREQGRMSFLGRFGDGCGGRSTAPCGAVSEGCVCLGLCYGFPLVSRCPERHRETSGYSPRPRWGRMRG